MYSLSLLITTLGIFFLGVIILLRLLIVNLHEFLAKHDPVTADILVVEGWLPDYALKAAIEEFQSGEYTTIITLGAPLPRGSYLSEYKNFAELSAATLIALGLNPEKLLTVPVDYSQEYRTKNEAIALKNYFATEDNLPQSLNIFTLGPHARRTWLVFNSVFPAPIVVGILATQPLNYESKGWWKSSDGARAVIGEVIAYLYQRFRG